MSPGRTIIPEASITSAGAAASGALHAPGPTAVIRSPSITTWPPKYTDRSSSIVTTVPLLITIIGRTPKRLHDAVLEQPRRLHARRTEREHGHAVDTERGQRANVLDRRGGISGQRHPPYEGR